MPETVQTASIVQETRRRYLNYALSVITARALPDVRDGLKPVQRRILYTMYHDQHLYADQKARKCATTVGAVIGNYHPHGDVAAYDALVRLAQGWVMRYPLVDGQSNFGSVDGDTAAHYRYTEARLALLAEHLMAELRQNTVELRDNFDATKTEPVVLPAQFPNLLVNGTAGIAVGMATNIPPHNLGEVIRASIFLIDNPEASTAQLLDRIKGPDFPLGGQVLADRPTLRKIYEEGTGSIKVQGEWKEEQAGKRRQIVITSIPYGVNKGNLEAAMGEIIAARKLPQLVGLANESNDKEGMRIVLEMKPEAEANLVMAYLYKHTALQENFAYNMTCLVPGPDGQPQPERLGLKAILRHFLDFRFATVRRRFEFELEQLRRRIHILEGFRIVFDALDKAIRLIRESDGKADASAKLIKAFKIDDIQAEAILDAQLYRLAQLEIKKILDELKDKKAEAARIEGILRSDKKLWGVIKEELNVLGEKFGDRRRTRMASAEDTPDFDPEAYIIRENTNVVLTRDGWIKRVGRLAAVESTRVREGDAVIAVAPGSTLDHVIFFASDGTAYTMRIHEVPASSGYGEPVAKFFRLGDEVRIIGALTTDERFTPPDQKPTNGEPPGPYLLVVTAQGQVLRTPLAPFRTESNKLGRRYVRLNEGDRVVLATVWNKEETIYLASASGHVIHFPVEEINILAGAGKGVMGIKLEEGDTCLGGALMGGRFDKMVLETAGGKTMEFGRGKYEVTSRGGKGFEAVKRTTFTRVVPPPIELVDWDQVEGKAEKNGQGRTLFE
ncbi:MAG: DNA topoisomerase 4 subunit A [Planctomycetes bacterium]|nr:DNA topoisomerase 4 subunit A [Planctomycetota bacterium]